MTKLLPRIIDAVYEDGVFRPTRKVALPERSRVRLTLVPLPARGAKERNRVVERQRKALLGIAGIGASGQTDISQNPHRAFYGARQALLQKFDFRLLNETLLRTSRRRPFVLSSGFPRCLSPRMFLRPIVVVLCSGVAAGPAQPRQRRELREAREAPAPPAYP